MTVKRMDNVGIVVEDLDAAIAFFTELGLELEGRAPIEGAWADGVTGLRNMRVEIAMMRTPDGHSRLELSRFLAPAVVADHRSAPVNALGYPTSPTRPGNAAPSPGQARATFSSNTLGSPNNAINPHANVPRHCR